VSIDDLRACQKVLYTQSHCGPKCGTHFLVAKTMQLPVKRSA
jgi:hypothetical protein